MGTLIKRTLSNGVTAIFSVVPELNMPATIACNIAVASGAASDPVGRKGLAHVVEHVVYRVLDEMVPRFGPGLTAAQQSRRVIYPRARTELDFTHYSLLAPVSCLDEVTSFIRSWILAPELTPEMSTRCVREVIDEKTEKEATTPATQAYDELYRIAFPNHPYGPFTVGSFQDLPSIGLTDIARFHKEHYRPSNLIVNFTFFGESSENDRTASMDQICESLLAMGNSGPKPIFHPLASGKCGYEKTTVQTRHTESTFLAGIELSPRVNDWAIQSLLLQALAGPLSELAKSAKPLVHSSAGFFPRLRDATFLEALFMPNDSNSAEQLEQMFLETLDRIRSGIPSDEFALAKKVALHLRKKEEASPLSFGEAIVVAEAVGSGAEAWAALPATLDDLTEEIFHRETQALSGKNHLSSVTTLPV